ncbi:MAG TPA: serine hydrolase domain-containing protein, partial [Candidatus Limnocylindrales bacterium]|nr:serine hydrolase domain-containing protein [Candidatus Limnocylindrales bacterium]
MTTDGRIEAVLAQVDGWGAERASVAAVGPDGVIATHGDLDHRYRWASVTKLVTALTVLIAADRGLMDLDEPAGPPGATVRHLLAHTSGLAFEGEAVLARPGTRRIYSNPGFDALGALVAIRAAAPFERALGAWVLEPLGMTATVLRDRPSQGLHGSLRDLAALARELLRPTLLPDATMAIATRVAFPGLAGVVPGVGRFDHCDWGLGLEIHGAKDPHWMGRRNSPQAFGHFGGAGTFLWVDPVADLALALLT